MDFFISLFIYYLRPHLHNYSLKVLLPFGSTINHYLNLSQFDYLNLKEDDLYFQLFLYCFLIIMHFLSFSIKLIKNFI